MNQLEGDIKSISDQFTRAVGSNRTKYRKAQETLRAEQEALAKWHSASAAFDAVRDPKSISIAESDNLADNQIRFKIFLLTTHYWEGRWLLEMQCLLPNLEQERKKDGRIASEKRWRRRMKLTPCIVSTFFMLPSLMKVRRREKADFVDDYLYDFADLLIVDEAGQVLPEVAGASFALSKKALVIGDTLQIEPIWSIPTRVDIGNLRKTGLVSDDENDDACNRFTGTGKSASSGSVMQIAQRTSRYYYDRSLARGMFLYEHRRCFDEIIQYCNLLCYRNKLIPKRGPKADADREVVLPALGFLHIDGMCQQTSGGSRHNVLEAETIAAWLAEHRSGLELQYRKPLHEIVGVITPFCSQVRAIIAACGKLQIKAGHLEEEVTSVQCILYRAQNGP